MKIFEPMLEHKYSTIASGATPIGSTGRAPNENSRNKKNEMKRKIEKIYVQIDSIQNIFEIIIMIPSYTPIGSIVHLLDNNKYHPTKWVAPSAEQRHPIIYSQNPSAMKILNAMIRKES